MTLPVGFGLMMLCAAIGIGVPVPVGARHLLNSKERLALSLVAQDRLARRELLSLLGPVHRASNGRFRRLHGVEFSTRGYATDYNGVCGRDAVTLWYAPFASAARNSARTPLHPYRFSLSSSFNITRELPAIPAASDHGGPSQDCARLAADRSAHWTTAATAQRMVQGTVMLAMSKAAVAADKLHVATCDGSPTGAGCGSLLATFSVAGLDSIDGEDVGDGRLRLELDFAGGFAATITARLADDRVTPVAIEQVKLASFVIVT